VAGIITRMDLFAIDDSAQRKPTRDGMGPLVAVGGVHVRGEKVRELEIALDALCVEAGFPPGEEFKWSPSKKSWMRDGLVEETRTEFFLDALALALDAGASAIVVMEDTSKNRASAGSSTPEEDVTMMFLERAHNHLSDDRHALVVFDRSGGNRSSDLEHLTSCIERIRAGTAYAKLDRLALALSSDSRLSRLIQLADVITACATSFVAGESNWSPDVFRGGVLPLIREDSGRKGGCGLKIHPDRRYGNLYHWLLEDKTFWRGNMGTGLPWDYFTCYRQSPDVA
jgi:hypothetical protein